jgi:cellobiose-specific phosphotransferase system component IIC
MNDKWQRRLDGFLDNFFSGLGTGIAIILSVKLFLWVFGVHHP